MSADDIRQDARRLREGITGRWSVKTNRHRECSGRDWGWIEGPRAHYCWTDDKPGQRADAEFIAAAPALVDRLLAELDQALARAEAAEAAIEQVRKALSNHPRPRCEKHPDDDDVISCGWKRAVRDVHRALDGGDQ